MSIVCRVATKNDIPSIQEIIKVGFSRYALLANKTAATPALSETAHDIEADIQNKYVFLALSENKPVGTARISIDGNTAYLSRFAVLEQGMGIGTVLLEHGAAYAAAQNATLLCLHTAASATPTISFYESCGFRVLSEAVWNGYHRLYMGKNL